MSQVVVDSDTFKGIHYYTPKIEPYPNPNLLVLLQVMVDSDTFKGIKLFYPQN
jgi:hypothetical protein